MAMDKQTKQLAVLGVLVVVAGIVAYFMVLKGDDTPAPAPGPIDKSAPPVPAGGTPAPAGGTPAPAGTTPGAAPQVQEVDPEMPTVLDWRPSRYEWTWPAPIGRADWKPNLERGELAVFDPLRVQNLDVVDPERQASINKIKDEWRLQGIIDRHGLVPAQREIEVMVPKKDETGKDVLDEKGQKVMVVDMIRETRPVMVPDVDAEGKQLYDEEGNQLWRQQIIDGEPQVEDVLDDDGQPRMIPRMKMETYMVPGRVLEAWFDGKRRPYRESDRLPNTRFTVKEIFIGKRFVDETTNESRVRSGVVLLGDTGAEITIFLTNDERYDD